MHRCIFTYHLRVADDFHRKFVFNIRSNKWEGVGSTKPEEKINFIADDITSDIRSEKLAIVYPGSFPRLNNFYPDSSRDKDYRTDRNKIGINSNRAVGN